MQEVMLLLCKMATLLTPRLLLLPLLLLLLLTLIIIKKLHQADIEVLGVRNLICWRPLGWVVKGVQAVLGLMAKRVKIFLGICPNAVDRNILPYSNNKIRQAILIINLDMRRPANRLRTLSHLHHLLHSQRGMPQMDSYKTNRTLRMVEYRMLHHLQRIRRLLCRTLSLEVERRVMIMGMIALRKMMDRRGGF